METTQQQEQVPQVFDDADTRLVSAGQQLDIYNAATPVNWQEERNRFLAGETDTPDFAYAVTDQQRQQAARLQEQLNKIQKRLEQVDHDGALGQFRDYYMNSIADMVEKARIIRHIGERSVVRDAATTIWGMPSDATVQYATSILQGDAPILDDLLQDPADVVVSSDSMRKHIETLLDRYGLTDWNIAYTDSVTHVVPEQKTIRLHYGENGRITGRKEQLLLHEFGVHVLRAANGWNQQFTMLGVGLHDYETTEEGITTYIEYRTGYLTEQVLREYALRTIAVDSVHTGDTFTETFDRLVQYTADETAYYIAMRAHRGGGFVKDHIYLEGFRQVKEHMDRQDDMQDLKDLYVGKIPLKELITGKELMIDDWLHPPRHDVEDVIDHLLEDRTAFPDDV